VGAVSGALVLLNPQAKEASDGVGLYWRYEKTLRAMESEIHSMPGATGAIYAIRRKLFVPLSTGTILDDVVVPMRIVLGGKRAIFDPSARAYGAVTQSPAIEYEKKKRTLAGNYQLFAEMPELLIPWHNPIFVQVVSHKFGRLIVPFCLTALFLSNMFILGRLFRLLLILQVIWYLLACVGWWMAHRGELSRDHSAPCGNRGNMGNTFGTVMLIPYIFVLMNWAPVGGLYYFVQGRSLGIWNSAQLRPLRKDV